ncbi:hypothetical protein RSSM_02997 [Rhodopirellula sallentina SM41]|uniref:Uncharacterized protein n=1 Tax=Rhodopirellula sallentina SM41 TaxID=1263870 RepID=M5U250_9BACT|nr:hypothetical protein RSSM_02997 [Rhodopirellula sallentina SM41]
MRRSGSFLPSFAPRYRSLAACRTVRPRPIHMSRTPKDGNFSVAAIIFLVGDV